MKLAPYGGVLIGFNGVVRDGQCGVVKHHGRKSVFVNRERGNVVVSDVFQVPAVGESAGTDMTELFREVDCAQPATSVEAIRTDCLKPDGEVNFGE